MTGTASSLVAFRLHWLQLRSTVQLGLALGLASYVLGSSSPCLLYTLLVCATHI